jgi:hypothetical protein
MFVARRLRQKKNKVTAAWLVCLVQTPSWSYALELELVDVNDAGVIMVVVVVVVRPRSSSSRITLRNASPRSWPTQKNDGRGFG